VAMAAVLPEAVLAVVLTAAMAVGALPEAVLAAVAAGRPYGHTG
jgi:hypothetical protein